MEYESRTFEAEIRVEGDVKPKIVGYAAVFEQLSENLGGFREKIRAGAFANALQNDVRALINHDANLVLGRNRAGTLKMEEDQKGLRVEIDPPDTSYARDLMVSIQRGDVSGMSFTFRTKTDEWTKEGDGSITRTLVEIERMMDLGPVTFPAYPQTSVSARSLETAKQMQEDSGVEHLESNDGAGEAQRNGEGAGSAADSTETRQAVDRLDVERARITLLNL